MTGAQIERVKARDRNSRGKRLSRLEYESFERMLRDLDLSRTRIKDAMGFAYDHVDCAEDIVDLIVGRLILSSELFASPSSLVDFSVRFLDSLTSSSTPAAAAAAAAAVQIAGLYLLSDILHNSAAPIKGASHFKSCIEGLLPVIFESIGRALRATTGRVSAFQVNDLILSVGYDRSLMIHCPCID
jgi:U2-associated protein SR140